MKLTRTLPVVLVCIVASAGAQSPSQRDVLARIRSEGLERSQAAAVFDYLTITIGPRLTASPAHKRAAEWRRDRALAADDDQFRPQGSAAAERSRLRADVGGLCDERGTAPAHARPGNAAAARATRRRRAQGGGRRGRAETQHR